MKSDSPHLSLSTLFSVLFFFEKREKRGKHGQGKGGNLIARIARTARPYTSVATPSLDEVRGMWSAGARPPCVESLRHDLFRVIAAFAL
jgi:hypothetical protein